MLFGNICTRQDVGVTSYRYAKEVELSAMVSRFIRVAIHTVKVSETSIKMLKDVGIEVPKSRESRSKCSMHADKGRG